MTEARVQAIEPVSALDIGEADSQVATRREPQIRASAARTGWQSRYAATLCLIDFAVGLCASSSALIL